MSAIFKVGHGYISCMFKNLKKTGADSGANLLYAIWWLYYINTFGQILLFELTIVLTFHRNVVILER